MPHNWRTTRGSVGECLYRLVPSRAEKPTRLHNRNSTSRGSIGVRWAPVMGVIPSAGSAVSAVSVSPNNAIRASTAALVLQLVAHILFHSFNQLQFNWIVNTRSNVLEIFIIDYFRSYLCYLDGFSGNYIHSHFNFSFCITCPALRLTYFHNLNQLCQLTFF